MSNPAPSPRDGKTTAIVTGDDISLAKARHLAIDANRLLVDKRCVAAAWLLADALAIVRRLAHASGANAGDLP